MRIVSVDELSASYPFVFDGSGSADITNNIVKTPSISVAKSGDELPITLSSTIENLEGNATYAWYMDGNILSGASEKDLVITAESGIAEGEHEFKLLVISETGIVWTSDAIAVSI